MRLLLILAILGASTMAVKGNGILGQAEEPPESSMKSQIEASRENEEFLSNPYWQTPLGKDILEISRLQMSGASREEIEAAENALREKHKLPKPGMNSIRSRPQPPMPGPPSLLPPEFRN